MSIRTSPRTLVLGGLAAAVLVAGCGAKSDIGKNVDKGKQQGAVDFDPSTTTIVATTLGSTTTTLGVKTTTPVVKATTTTKAVTTTTTQPPISAKITSTNFDPQNLRVFVGVKFVYTNTDTQPRGLKATTGQFASPKIAPGGTWEFTIPAAGKYDIVDEDRPFVVGSITAVNK